MKKDDDINSSPLLFKKQSIDRIYSDISANDFEIAKYFVTNLGH